MIDIREVVWAREIKQPPQTLALVFTKTAGHKTSPGSMLHCQNQLRGWGTTAAAAKSYRSAKILPNSLSVNRAPFLNSPKPLFQDEDLSARRLELHVFLAYIR